MSENSCGATLSDADAKARYGPNWRDVDAVIRRAAALTDDDIARAADVGDARYAEWRAMPAAQEAAEAGGRGRAAARARSDAWEAARAATLARAAWAAATPAAWDVAGDAGDAAAAAAVSDMIDKQHYDTLTRPWRVVIGIETQGER